MDIVTIGAGFVPVCYGLFTIWARKNRPDMVSKMEPMKKMWGEGPGLALHVVAYSLLPIALGGVLVWAGVKGVSLSAFFGE